MRESVFRRLALYCAFIMSLAALSHSVMADPFGLDDVSDGKELSRERDVGGDQYLLAYSDPSRSSDWDIAWTIAQSQLDCSEGCQFWIKGAFQTLLVTLESGGTVSTEPLLLTEKAEFEELPRVDLPFRNGTRLLRIGDYYFGVWVLFNGELVFGAALNNDEVTQTDKKEIDTSAFGGGTFNTNDDCPLKTVVKARQCTKKADGSIHLLLVEHKVNCVGAVVEIVVVEVTIPSSVAGMVDCSGGV